MSLVEDEDLYECLACGRTDWEDFNDESEDKRSHGGIIYPSNGYEVFICSYCRYFIEGK